MTTPILCLVGFVAWTLLLLGIIMFYRSVLVLLGKKRANDFPADELHGGTAYRRLIRAHLNCVENLPIFATIVLSATVAGVSTPTMTAASQVVLGARVAQSTTHLISASHWAVQIRFTFFVIQYMAIVAMIAQILGSE